MPKINFSTIDKYISTFPKDVQKELETIRETIIKTAPEAEESISYQIPTFKINGRYLIYFAGFKNHVSIYPAPRAAAEFKKELSEYKGGKGTVQFPLDKPIPLSLIRRIVKYRIKENFNKVNNKRKVK
jgi:uncharacterized protein YdhG (YjbR/CyaY superfamily)